MNTHPDPKPMTDEQTKAGAVLPILAEANAQRIEAECFNWLCAHPNWRFIEELCLRLTAEDTNGFKAQLIAEITKRCGMNEFHRVCDETMASTPQPPPEAGSVGVPEGWQLVPKEPTEAMMAAAWDHTPLEMDDMTDGYFGQAYRDMLSAAPAPKETECFCDRTGLGRKGVSCGDCPKDYAPKETKP